MELVISLVLLFCAFVLPNLITDFKFQNRTPLDGYRTNYGAMSHDLAMGKSKNEVMKKANKGGYDIPK